MRSLIEKFDCGWDCENVEVYVAMGDDILLTLGVEGYDERI